MKKPLPLLLSALLLAAAPAFGIPLTNPGFENDGTGWTVEAIGGTVTFVNAFGSLSAPAEGATFSVVNGQNIGRGELTQNFDIDTSSTLSLFATGTIGPDGGDATITLLRWSDEDPIIVPFGLGMRPLGTARLMPFADLFDAAVGADLRWEEFETLLEPGRYQVRITAEYDAIAAIDGLVLTKATVPITGTVPLLAIGAIGLALSRKKWNES